MRLPQCLHGDVRRMDQRVEVLIMGDFNGHLETLDGKQNGNGRLLRRLTDDLDLEVVNLRDTCMGQFIWCARNSRTCIDYVPTSPTPRRKLQSMYIDEDETF